MNTPEEPNPYRSPEVRETSKTSNSLEAFWAVLCVVGVIAIVLLPFAPGISILLAIGLAPAFVHAYVRLVRHMQDTGIPQPLFQLGIMLGSLGICLMLAFAAFVAGGILCVSTLFVFSNFSRGEDEVIPFAFLLGIVVPFGLYWVLFARSLGYFRDRNAASNLPDDESNPKNAK